LLSCLLEQWLTTDTPDFVKSSTLRNKDLGFLLDTEPSKGILDEKCYTCELYRVDSTPVNAGVHLMPKVTEDPGTIQAKICIHVTWVLVYM
jgi:hypothetical protein